MRTITVNFALLPAVFGLVFVWELPDKTALAALVMGSRYRASWVFAGVAAAFAMHVTIAVALGSALTLIPYRLVELVVGILFLLGAVLLIRDRGENEEDAGDTVAGKPVTFPRVAGTAFAVIAVAEFGDLTQILTATLAAKYHDPLTVGLGAVLALWAVGGLAIAGGKNLLRVVPLKAVTRIAATIMGVLAVVSLMAAARG